MATEAGIVPSINIKYVSQNVFIEDRTDLEKSVIVLVIILVCKWGIINISYI